MFLASFREWRRSSEPGRPSVSLLASTSGQNPSTSVSDAIRPKNRKTRLRSKGFSCIFFHMKSDWVPPGGDVVTPNKCASSLWIDSPCSVHVCVQACVSMHTVKTGNERMIACFFASSGADLTDYKHWGLVRMHACMHTYLHARVHARHLHED